MSVPMSALSSFKLGDCVNCYGVHCPSHANESSGLSIDVVAVNEAKSRFYFATQDPTFFIYEIFSNLFSPTYKC